MVQYPGERDSWAVLASSLVFCLSFLFLLEEASEIERGQGPGIIGRPVMPWKKKMRHSRREFLVAMVPLGNYAMCHVTMWFELLLYYLLYRPYGGIGDAGRDLGKAKPLYTSEIEWEADRSGAGKGKEAGGRKGFEKRFGNFGTSGRHLTLTGRGFRSPISRIRVQSAIRTVLLSVL